MMWFIGFLFHEMAFGLLSVLLPLYIINHLGLSLTDVGIITAIAGFVAVPFSFLWGYLCDKTKQYRFYILLSFSVMTLLLYLFSLTDVVIILTILYAAVAIFHVAHEAPKNVLISEYYSRSEWKFSFASYGALAKLGWLFGLLLGFVLSNYGFASTSLLLLTCLLNFIAFASSFFLVKDPLFIFERRLVSIERAVSLVDRSSYLVSKVLDGIPITIDLKNENVSAFCTGLFLFSFAVSIFLNPLPVFFYANFSIPFSIVFAVFLLMSLGSFLGCLYARWQSAAIDDKTLVLRVSLLIGILSLFPVSAILWVNAFTFSFSVAVLIVMGFASGLFPISSIALSMELIPEGKAGAYNALVGIGAALGCFVGPFIADHFGFIWPFIISSIFFFLSFTVFQRFAE